MNLGLSLSLGGMRAGGGGGSATIAFVDEFKSDANASSYSKSCNLGAAASDRVIAIAVVCRAVSNPTLTCTVGGVAAASIVAIENSGSKVEMFDVLVPAGATATVEIASSVGLVRCGFAVYRMTGVAVGASVTGTNSGGGTAASLGATISPTEQGVGIGAIYAARANRQYFSAASSDEIEAGSQTISADVSSVNSSVTWTGLTEDVDAELEIAISGPQAFAVAVWYQP